MINARDFTEYSDTYYVEIRNGETYDKVSANSPIEAARKFKPDAVKCKKNEALIYVVSNGYRFDEKVKNNYYK